MNMFEEIEHEKKKIPKMDTMTKKVTKYDYNGYQILSIIMFCLCIILGIIFGNLFPACGSTGTFYSDVCLTNEFNVSLMLLIWFVGFLICLFFFAIGHIILLLDGIKKKLK